MLQRAVRIFLGLFFAQLSLGGTSAAEINRGDVVVLPMDQEISSSLALFIRRGVKTAES